MRKQQLTPIGEWLRQRCRALGITQQQLATLSGVSDSTLSEIARGEIEFNSKHAKKLAGAKDLEGNRLLGVRASTLLGIADPDDDSDNQDDVAIIAEAASSLSSRDKDFILSEILLLKRRTLQGTIGGSNEPRRSIKAEGEPRRPQDKKGTGKTST